MTRLGRTYRRVGEIKKGPRVGEFEDACWILGLPRQSQQLFTCSGVLLGWSYSHVDAEEVGRWLVRGRKGEGEQEEVRVVEERVGVW